MEKIYIVDEHTVNAVKAMKAHREGKDVFVLTIVDDELIKNIKIPGADPVAKGERNAAEENRQQCKHIAHEIEAYADGAVHRCPECDEEIRFPDNVGDKYRCPHCHTVADIEDYEQLSIWDYMNDILDIDFIVSRDREYKSCKICVAWGGPNIYIDTASAYVKLYWWTEYADYPLSYSARDAIDEWAEEYWNM
jgi:predicted RNA-binding Zn-ribbon protein involved in translation (DUF1610 family)